MATKGANSFSTEHIDMKDKGESYAEKAEVAPEATPETADSVAEPSVAPSADSATEPAAEQLSPAQQIANLSDQLLRSQAESQNVRRIAERDKALARSYGVEQVVKSLLPGLDGLEHALQAFAKAKADADSPQLKALAEGVQLTLTGFEAGLKQSRTVPIEALGQPFNPERHMPTGVRPVAVGETVTEPLVLEVLQRGWMIGDRVLRPAMVVISGPAQPAEAAATENKDRDVPEAEASAANQEQQSRGKEQ